MDPIEQLSADREIRALVSLYAQHADDVRSVEFGALFATDGLMKAGGEENTGPEAVGAWLLKVAGHGLLRHHFTNHVVTLDSETAAHGTVDLLLLVHQDGAYTVAGSTRYADRYVKENGAWRFAERSITAYPLPPREA